MENIERKALIFVGLFSQQLKDLIEHLETTGYNEEEISHLKEVLNDSNDYAS